MSRYEIVNAEVSVGDVDETERELSTLLEDLRALQCTLEESVVAEEASNEMTRGQQNPPLDFSHRYLEPSTLVGNYEDLSQEYLSPLPRSVPGRTRIVLDRSLRNIALELCLASHLARPVHSLFLDNESQALFDTEPHERLALDLPLRKKPSTSSLAGNNASMQESRPGADLLKAPLGPGQTEDPKSRQSTQSDNNEDPALSNSEAGGPASEYPNLLKNLSPQPKLPRELSSILAHWTVGADPNSYDWAATTRALIENEDSSSQAESSQARRAKRKKQTKESVEYWSADRLLRKRNPEGSQPLPQKGLESQAEHGASYSQAATDGIPTVTASQPTRGPFGSRFGQAKGSVTKPKKRAGF